MTFLIGKKILISGIASKRSIAYGIAKVMKMQGAELALTYQNDKLKNRVKEIAKELDINITLSCDVSSDENISKLFFALKKHWKKFDGFVHSIGFAPIDQLSDDYLDAVTREGFKVAHDISSYSFVAMAKACITMLNENACLLTLSYLGAERVVPNYNVMGVAKASLEANVKYMAYSLGQKNIRVNAISSGPIRTLAASGIKNFRKMLTTYEEATPLKRKITIEDIGNTAAFLTSNFASAITGEIIHVDGGFNTIAINAKL